MWGSCSPGAGGMERPFPEHSTLRTQAQSGVSCLRRVRMKGQCLSVCSPPPSISRFFHLPLVHSLPFLIAFPLQTPCPTQIRRSRGIVFSSLRGWRSLLSDMPAGRPVTHRNPESSGDSDSPQQPPYSDLALYSFPLRFLCTEALGDG